MKDLNKVDIGEKASDNQNDSEKETVEQTTAKQSSALTENSVETKPIKPVGKKAPKAVKISVVKAPKKEKPATEPMVQNVVIVDPKGEQEKPEPEKEQKDKIKVAKENAKKAEKKVDKLKKKVKKAKKKEVKPNKLKALKEKLEKALAKLKSNIKKLQKAKE